MMSSIKPFHRVTLANASILDYPATHRILKNLKKYNLLPSDFSNSDLEIVDSTHESQKLAFTAPQNKPPLNHPVGAGKRILHLATQPGLSIKQCPGTTKMLCCHYHIINMVSNCPFDCSYCYLQTYLNQPMTTFFVNEDDIYKQVAELCARPPVAQLRVGTGELADSLAFDPITEFSVRLAEVMAPFENVRLELKTKSHHVEHLMSLPKKDHVVIGWSMNPSEIIDREEHGTARFHERVRAAKMAADAGFGVAFHFDPMIYIEKWETYYKNAAEIIFKEIPHKQIRWVSIGGLRYLPALKPIALKRHPETSLFDEETIAGDDGKIRYLRNIRTEMFTFLNKTIKEVAPSVYTYLCMESVPVWEKALGRLPDRGF